MVSETESSSGGDGGFGEGGLDLRVGLLHCKLVGGRVLSFGTGEPRRCPSPACRRTDRIGSPAVPLRHRRPCSPPQLHSLRSAPSSRYKDDLLVVGLPVPKDDGLDATARVVGDLTARLPDVGAAARVIDWSADLGCLGFVLVIMLRMYVLLVRWGLSFH
jgi:hypothetical protein